MARRFAALGRFHIFAVEDRALQLAWARLPAGLLVLRIGGHEVELDQPGGPGALTISGLQPETDYECMASVEQSSFVARATTRTLPAAPGRELCRLGTVNDMHIGSSKFGVSHTMKERPRPPVASGLRCAEAAFDELDSWDIDHVFIKGDAIDHNLPHEWQDLGSLISGRPWSVDLGFGNHELRNNRLAHHGAHRAGLAPVVPVRWADLPGIRVIMAETAIAGEGHGTIAPVTEEVTDLAAETSLPVIIFMHHQLETRSFRYMLPAGIPFEESQTFVANVSAANPNAIVASGHTHRHRRRDVRSASGGLATIVEVGSTKDFPGTWAGYAVHEGGIRQVVRRIERPDCITWTEHTRRAVLGAWGRWSPGSLADRCWMRTWNTATGH